jgi:IclR family pca regulon transcriptional regulator
VDLGYVRCEDRRFLLTPSVLELGYSFLSSLTLPEIAQPHLRDLVQQVHESSSVSVLDGTDVVYVAREPTHRIMTVAIAVGTRFPAFATSMGRVLLAGLDEAELDRFFARAELAPLTAATVTSEGALRIVLGRVRDQGWALVDQELEDGLRAVAVPIRDAQAKVVAAVNLSTQANRRTPLMIEQELLPPLLDTSDRIERELAAGGYAS